MDRSDAENAGPLQVRLLANLRMRSLTIFVTVVQSGGATRAAEALGLSQPAVTRTIRELEEMFGLLLFRKAGRRRLPTAAGEALFRHARRLLSEVRATAEDLQSGDGEGRVRVGVLLAAAARLLPRAIKLSKRRFPRVVIRVHDAAGDVLLPMLAAGEIDMVVGRISSFDRKAGFRHEVLYEEPVVVCARPQHPLFKLSRRHARIAEIAGYPWILPPPGVALRHEIDQALESARCAAPADIVESVSMPTNRTLLLSTDTIAFLPSQVVAEDVSLGLLRTVAVPFDLTTDSVGVTFREDADLAPPALHFADCVRAAARTLTRRRAKP